MIKSVEIALMQVPVSTDFVICFLFEVEDQVTATGQLVVRDMLLINF